LILITLSTNAKVIADYKLGGIIMADNIIETETGVHADSIIRTDFYDSAEVKARTYTFLELQHMVFVRNLSPEFEITVTTDAETKVIAIGSEYLFESETKTLVVSSPDLGTNKTAGFYVRSFKSAVEPVVEPVVEPTTDVTVDTTTEPVVTADATIDTTATTADATAITDTTTV
jgi:hypothetical protein